MPVLGLGHALADVFLLKWAPQPSGDPGGHRLLRPGGPGAAEVARAPRRRPAGRLRHELPQVRHRGPRAGAGWLDAGAAHRPAEARRRDGARRGGVPERPRVPARRPDRRRTRRASVQVHADGRGAGDPDIDASLDEQGAKTRFWNAFKALGPWWAEAASPRRAPRASAASSAVILARRPALGGLLASPNEALKVRRRLRRRASSRSSAVHGLGALRRPGTASSPLRDARPCSGSSARRAAATRAACWR